MDGTFTAAQAGAFLALLNTQPFTSTVLCALAQCMRQHAKPVQLSVQVQREPPYDGTVANATAASLRPVVDIVGTGGDGHNTFNASTAAALLCAAADQLLVLKHGNRAVTSHCGSADLLEALGDVVVDTAGTKTASTLDPARGVEYVAEQCGFAFLYAPVFHPATRHVQMVRKSLPRIRTVFNVLGPLTNPAVPTRVLLGVYRRELGPVFAQCLARLGVVKGLVVHGANGLDEISPEGLTYAWYVDVAYGVHADMKGHTGAALTSG